MKIEWGTAYILFNWPLAVTNLNKADLDVNFLDKRWHILKKVVDISGIIWYDVCVNLGSHWVGWVPEMNIEV